MPVDPKTGKEYPYTDEGIAQHKEDTGGMPMKNSGFKMRSGNATPFKQMGSTPAKGIVSKLMGAGIKKAIGGAGLNVGPGMPLIESPTKQPNFNWTGSSAETEKFGKYQNQPKPTTPKGFNIKGSSAEGSITADKYKAKPKVNPKVKAFKEFDKWHKTLGKTKSVISKAGKFVGGKALGTLGMMFGKTSTADQPPDNEPKKLSQEELLDISRSLPTTSSELFKKIKP